MKEDIFNQYVERVTNLFGISKEDFFSKTKARDLVDARHLVYYLSINRNINLIMIKRFMDKNGYMVPHQTISHGIKIVKEKITNDKDYETIIKDIDNAVFI